MFVDACAIVSMISREPDADRYNNAIRREKEPFTSALAVFEAVLVLARPAKLAIPLSVAEALVCIWIVERGIELRECAVPPRDTIAHAVRAARDFGLSRRKLSAFDCFHYAFAKASDSVMLSNDAALRSTDLVCAP